jgi:hypothetical protein
MSKGHQPPLIMPDGLWGASSRCAEADPPIEVPGRKPLDDRNRLFADRGCDHNSYRRKRFLLAT